MCGRYTLTHEERLLKKLLKAAFDIYLKPRFNIAPTQPIPIARIEPFTNRRHLTFAHWGLIPSWSKDPSIASKLINARSETLREKPSFRGAYKYRRCLIPATGFYEWKATTSKGPKTPHYIHMLDGSPFAFAGLWETYLSPDGSEIDTATIITTEANPLIKELHPRMPVIIPPKHYSTWLDPDNPKALTLDELLTPYPADEMDYYPVSTAVNNVKNDSPELLTRSSLF